ncbi:hypothetical protein C4K08_0324 [Pseudomonas chlororaphis subsp. aureofaciens]|nr:hypothetical protein C4K08_0324 [Pseudomonas chlororaphis subsp. aureofaciens]
MDAASHRLSAVAAWRPLRGRSQPAAAATHDRVYRTIGLHPVAAAEHREAAIDREAGAALELAGGPSDLSQPAAAATPIACTEVSDYTL